MTLNILFALILLLFLFAFAILFLILEIYVVIIGHLKGAPVVPSNRRKIKTMIDAAKIREGERAVDLGSGDGSVVLAAARRGACATGIEINPFLVLYSRWRIKRAGLQTNALIIKGDFWAYPLSDTDILFLYLLPKTLQKLEKKFMQELKPSARIISNDFQIAGWTPIEVRDKVYLYKNKI